MRILHTADWHIGKKLYGRQRFAEYEAFLQWLLGVLVEEDIDGLIVAGDIFDTSNPSEQSRRLYQEFIAQACKRCDWIVITGGNHDSPSVLDGARELLRHLNVYVVGKQRENRADELVEIPNSSGDTSIFIAAVPYLRDRDLRQTVAGESDKEKEAKLRNGIKQHYDELAEMIAEKQGDKKVPAIAVGHLYAAGCSAETEGDGVRDLYVGGLGHVSAKTFSEVYDYVALGHIHVPQVVGKCEHIRYSGSPIPMGYGEAGQQKQVMVVEFNPTGAMSLEVVKVPIFQELKRLKGNMKEIAEQLNHLLEIKQSAWLEVVYTGEEYKGDIRSEVMAMVEGSALEVLRVENRVLRQRTMRAEVAEESLNELSAEEVFHRCLVDYQVAENEHVELKQAYREIVSAIEVEEVR